MSHVDFGGKNFQAKGMSEKAPGSCWRNSKEADLGEAQ